MKDECKHEDALEVNHDNFTQLYHIRCADCGLRGLGQRSVSLAMVAWKAMYEPRAVVEID